MGGHRQARDPENTSAATATKGSAAPAEKTQDLAEEARKLYPYIRSALESDLRRQLESKSRASRFRP
jgi:hypothetical protein